MRERLVAIAAALVALAATGAARAQEPPNLGELQTAAKAVQAACVRDGENAQVCACGVGIAYARLDPRVFVVVPALEPLLKEKDPLRVIAGVAQVATSRNLSIADAQKAYETVRANRQEVKNICHPLRPGAKGA
jgi:hypothetical protein